MRGHIPLRDQLSLIRFFARNTPDKLRLSGWRAKDAVTRARRKTRLFPMRGMINRRWDRGVVCRKCKE